MNNTVKKLCTLVCVSGLLVSIGGCSRQQTQSDAIPESIEVTETVETTESASTVGIEESAPKLKEPLP